MDLLNGGLFVGLGVALLRRTDLAPFWDGGFMLMHGRIGVMEEYVVVGGSLMGAHCLVSWRHWLYVCYWSYLLAVCRSST